MKKALTSLTVVFLLSIYTYAQEKITLNVKDLNSDIQKYVKKNYEGFKITEAFEYDLIYEMVVQKEGVKVPLVFNRKGEFLYKKTDADKAKVANQTRMSLALDDVESDIKKYIKNNYDGHKLNEAYKYEEVYTTKIIKGTETEVLLFDKEGAFVKKVTKPAPQAEQKKDSIPVKQEAIIDSVPVKAEPVKTDSLK